MCRKVVADCNWRLTQEVNTFVCAPSTIQVANELLERSPLVFKHISNPLHTVLEQPSDESKPFDVAVPLEIHMVDQDAQDDERRPAQDFGSDPIKTFKVHINPSQDYYPHKRAIERNSLHGPWPETFKEDQDFTYFALSEAIPANMAKEGLCDWTTGGQLNEDVKHMRSMDPASHEWHIQQRKLRKQENRAVLMGSGEDELVFWSTADPKERRRQVEEARLQAALHQPNYLGLQKTKTAVPDTPLGAELHDVESMQKIKSKKRDSQSPMSASDFAREFHGHDRSPANARHGPPKRVVLDESALRLHYWARNTIPATGTRFRSILHSDVEDKPFRLEDFSELPKENTQPFVERSLMRGEPNDMASNPKGS